MPVCFIHISRADTADVHTLAATESAAEIVLLLQVSNKVEHLFNSSAIFVSLTNLIHPLQTTEAGRKNVDDLLSGIINDDIELLNSAANSIISTFTQS